MAVYQCSDLAVKDFVYIEGHLKTQDSEDFALPVGTAFHERTFPLCHSLNYREWSGYYTVSVTKCITSTSTTPSATRAALIDISPLYKYI